MDGIGDPRIKDPIIRLGLKLRHTDVLILSQFLRPDGTILPRQVTGLTNGSQYYIEMLIERAQNAGPWYGFLLVTWQLLVREAYAFVF